MNISGNITIVENEISAPITQARDAYQLALATGFVGTLAEWLESLEGADGAAGGTGPAGPNSVTSATTSDATASLSIQNLTLAEALPVESGGTGGNTTSSARTALGLGGSSIVSFRELRANRLTFGRVVAAGGVSIVPSPPDAGFSRLDANSIALGNGETNDATGSLTLANITATGTITTDGGIAFTGGAAGGAASVTRTNLGLTNGTAALTLASFSSVQGQFSCGLLVLGYGKSFAEIYTDGNKPIRISPTFNAGASSVLEVANDGVTIRTNLTASGSITANSLALATPLPITSGGTGGNTASTARTALKVPASDETGIAGASPLSNIISISQADYDALAVTDPATLYVIA